MEQKNKNIDKGKQGEIEVSGILKEKGWEIRCLDRLGQTKDGRWFFIEVKNKEPWQPPPAFRQGIPNYQYTFYKQMEYLHKLRTLLIVRGKNNEWLCNFIGELRVNDAKTLSDGKHYVFFNLEQFQSLEKFLVWTAIVTEAKA